MDFYEQLCEIGLENILVKPEYKSIKMINSDHIYDMINDIRITNAKVFLYGDYDTDGLMCIKVWEEFFRLIGFTNYKTYTFTERMHNLDPRAVKQAIEEKFEYIIINDTGSSELGDNGLINKLIDFGLKVIVIDHHQTKYVYSDYPKDCAIVNSTIENKMCPEQPPILLSAGALCFVILDNYISEFKSSINTDVLAIFALISLYADCVDMSSKLNRAIYYKAMRVDYRNIPKCISLFLKHNNKFSRRFIEFQYTPKINCVFRNELFGLLNDYVALKSDKDIPLMVKKIEMLSNLHVMSADMVNQVADIIEHEVLDNFVIANLNSVNSYINVEENKLYNYTGLVANRLAERYGKSAVVWCLHGDEVKGSFRDLLSRSYLKTFQQFCIANGHNPAFGFHIRPLEFDSFIQFIKRIDKKFFIKGEPNRPIVVDHVSKEPDLKLLSDVATYNEFGGNMIPIALVRKRYTSDIKESSSKYGGYTYKWGKFFITSKHRYKYGDYILVKPTVEKSLRLYGV